jgi:hypothetical protein
MNTSPAKLSPAARRFRGPKFTTPYATVFASALLVLQGVDRPDDSAGRDAVDAQVRELSNLVRTTMWWLGVHPLLHNPDYTPDPNAAAAIAETAVLRIFEQGVREFAVVSDFVEWIARGVVQSRPGRPARMQAYAVALAVVRGTTTRSVTVIDADAPVGMPIVRRQYGTPRQHEFRLGLARILDLTPEEVGDIERTLDEGWAEILAELAPMAGRN